jgi:hypothetical protein
MRRAVFEREGNQCTYVSTTGKRCEATHRLEFDHLTPFAAGGEHAVSNLTLRCAAHNALAAEEAFGRELVEQKKRASGHDTFRSQAAGDSPDAYSAAKPRKHRLLSADGFAMRVESARSDQTDEKQRGRRRIHAASIFGRPRSLRSWLEEPDAGILHFRIRGSLRPSRSLHHRPL